MRVIRFAGICHVIKFRRKLSGVASCNHYDLVVIFFFSHNVINIFNYFLS